MVQTAKIITMVFPRLPENIKFTVENMQALFDQKLPNASFPKIVNLEERGNELMAIEFEKGKKLNQQQQDAIISVIEGLRNQVIIEEREEVVSEPAPAITKRR